MRRQISSKSNTCTECADVDVTDISVKVGVHYPGRSVGNRQKSAKAIVEHLDRAEGPNVMERHRNLTFRL